MAREFLWEFSALLFSAIENKKYHPERYILNLVIPNQIWIVSTIFPINLATNGIPLGAKSIGKANYNLNLVWINQIKNRINK